MAEDKKKKQSEDEKILLSWKGKMQPIQEHLDFLRASFTKTYKADAGERVGRYKAVQAVVKKYPDVTARVIVVLLWPRAEGNVNIRRYTEGSIGRFMLLAGKVKKTKDGKVIASGVDFTKEYDGQALTPNRVAEMLSDKSDKSLVDSFRKAGVIPKAGTRTPTAGYRKFPGSGTAILESMKVTLQDWSGDHGIDTATAPLLVAVYQIMGPLVQTAHGILKQTGKQAA